VYDRAGNFEIYVMNAPPAPIPLWIQGEAAGVFTGTQPRGLAIDKPKKTAARQTRDKSLPPSTLPLKRFSTRRSGVCAQR
jgi:hypothetical protein